MFQAYVIRNLIDGKVYIGITSRPLHKRWAEHLYESRRRRNHMTVSFAISKHGSGSFCMEALCCARSWNDISEVEKVLIAQFGCLAPHGYNLRPGGEGAYGHKPTDDAIERSAAKHRGKPCHQNTVAASRARRGVPKPPGHGAKVADALRGGKRSEETKAKISAYWAARRASGAFKTQRAYAHHAKGERDDREDTRAVEQAHSEDV